MNEQGPEECSRRLQREFASAGNATDGRLPALRTELERMRLKMAALKEFPATSFFDFAERFPQNLGQMIEEVDPESH